jgi:hypothetical protein
MSLVACGGAKGGGSAPSDAQASLISDGGAEMISTAPTLETTRPTKIVAVPGGTGAALALFPDGVAYYSPDGFNLGGGGSSVVANGSGNLKIVDIVPVGGGLDTLFSNGSVYFSPDGLNLSGGGSSVAAYSGATNIASLTALPDGVDVLFEGGHSVYFSPDGLNLGGGGGSVNVYAGNSTVLQVVPVGIGDGVVTLFKDGSAYFSPDNRDLGGGGATVAAAPGGTSKITLLVQVGGGVIAQFDNGNVYLSPDGQHLAGGGSSVKVFEWNTTIAAGAFGKRDSAHGAEFGGHLWLSGGYNDPTNTASCNNTCSYFDLWSSKDLTGAAWNDTASFATSTSPDPRDAAPVGDDVAVPTDFYDSYSPLVVWNNRLFALGATVWSSPDGTTWAMQKLADGVTPAAGPTRANENSRALAIGGVLYFLQPDSGEVYSATDVNAETWSDLDTIYGFPLRCGAGAFALQGKLWIVGGGACDYSQTYNDIWSSSDGLHWTQSTTPAAWSARMWPCIASGDDGIVWLVGGYAPTDWNNSGGVISPRFSVNRSDVWYTKDGLTWKQYKADYGSGLSDGNALEPRHAATCYVGTTSDGTANSLVVVAGTSTPTPSTTSNHVSNTIRTVTLPATSSMP